MKGEASRRGAGCGGRVLLAAVTVWGALSVFTTVAAQPLTSDWYMAGANPSRSSWVSAEVRGDLRPVWQVPIEPYVSPRAQVVAAGGRLYLSTARGLYCFEANSGRLLWVYATRFPLGNSPTVVGGVAYVGGLDRRMHAIDAASGARVWISPQAGAGFQTNPLVVSGRVFAGNRDGHFYAYDAASGALQWRYRTDGPILFSAALYGGRLYFASNDSHVYALTQTGSLVWKSAKLPGQGFGSWWPVVYQDPGGVAANDRIIVSGSVNYRNLIRPGRPSEAADHLHYQELRDVYPSGAQEPVGTVGSARGPWLSGTPTLSAARILDYLAAKPHRRTVFVLDPLTGVERETAPLLMAWTHSGTRFPPVVGHDGALYQQMNHRGGEWIAGGSVGAWVPGNGNIVPGTQDPRGSEFAADEPVVSAAGGKLIYSSLCCDRVASAYDVTDRSQRWTYFGYNLSSLAPGYNAGYFWNGRDYSHGAIMVSFGASGNGVYGVHGDQNPPIPHEGRLFLHRGNTLIAFAPSAASSARLPLAPVMAAPPDEFEPLGSAGLRERLEAEVAKIVAAGHLRPGYTSHGLFDHDGQTVCGDRLSDYWHTPVDNLYPLIRALPHLSGATRDALRAYIQSEFAVYPPHTTDHIGWRGAPREIFDTPPEVISQMNASSPTEFNWVFDNGGGWEGRGVWGRNPMLFYLLWRYAEAFGDASALYESSLGALESPPADIVLIKNPYAANAFIAGYVGFLGLERLAGRPETESARTTLNRLLDLRRRNFTRESPYKNASPRSEAAACQQMNVASNFMYLVPELASYLRLHLLPQVQEAVREYETLAPHWMVSLTSDGMTENAVSPMHDTNALFQAKALILGEPARDLERYLDVPGFWRGDMYYLSNLVTALDAYGGPGAPKGVHIVP